MCDYLNKEYCYLLLLNASSHIPTVSVIIQALARGWRAHLDRITIKQRMIFSLVE